MIPILRLTVVLCGLTLITSRALPAQDRLFTYTYQSTVLNSGQRELEVWNTMRNDRGSFYRALDTRLEFEIGLGADLQTSFYLNAKTTAQRNAATKELTLSTETSFSNEWKYKLLDPVADPVGMALYAELGIAGDEIELEGKLIFDKKAGPTLHALNLVAEQGYEWAADSASGRTLAEGELSAKIEYGFSYMLSHHFNLGVELSNRMHFHDGTLEHAVLFAGPGFSYYSDKFWVNFTLMPQITAFKGATSGGLALDEFEKLEARLIFSLSL